MTSRRFNEALENIRMSPIVAISEEAKGRAAEFEKSGRSFLTFQRGEIDFVEVPLNEDFSVDCDKVERTVKGRDFFYLNNPQNPTGKVFGEDELIRIVEICTRHGCFIVSDESYEKIVYDGLEDIPGVRIARPEGVFHMFPNFS